MVVGQEGMAWGDGVMAVPPHTAADPVKHEGDGRSPAGIFRIGTAFGYAAAKPAAWAIPYRVLTPETECIDDPTSRHYSQIVEQTEVTPDWKSSEHMRAEGVYYEWGAVIDQNPDTRPGEGSCVFLHASDDSGAGTEGCTAMKKTHLETMLGWLKPNRKPLMVEMPVEQYRQVERVLDLPSE